MISRFVLFSIQPTLKPFYKFTDVETGCCSDITILHTAYCTPHAIFYEGTSNLNLSHHAVQRDRACFYSLLNSLVAQWLGIQGECTLLFSKYFFLVHSMVCDVQLQ